jgi:hypothetical protein
LVQLKNSELAGRALTRLSGRTLLAARLAWVAVMVLAVVSLAAGVPSRYAQLSTVAPAADTIVGQLRPEDARLLVQSGLPVRSCALYFTAVELLAAVISLVVAIVIVMGRPDDWMALFVSVFLIAASMTLPLIPALEAAHPEWGPIGLAWRIMFLGGLIPLFCLFPDGRFVPRWTRWLAAATLVYVMLGAFFPRLQFPTAFGRGLTAADAPAVLLAVIAFAFGLLGQFWRYFRVSSAIERQRTRWVVFGFSVLLIAFILGVSTLTYLPDAQAGLGYVLARLAGPTFILLGLEAVAVTIGVSVLRFHLWDVDVIVRRTLVYAVLSSLLVLAYFGSVIILQSLLRILTGDDQSPLVTVASTLAIAALFVPLRNPVQTIIDRRFYRRKFDAARTLAGFAAFARDETNLERLSDDLVQVVDQTMEPARVSLWLRKIDH